MHRAWVLRVDYFVLAADGPIVEQLAITQAKYVIARFLQTFDAIQSSSDTCTMKHQTDISTTYVFGSKVKFHRGRGRAEDHSLASGITAQVPCSD